MLNNVFTREQELIPPDARRFVMFCGNVLDRPDRNTLRLNPDVVASLLALPKYKSMPTEDLAARAQVHLRRTNAEKLFANQVEHPDRVLAIDILEGVR